ncbi:type II 3-dehydroquinate dehydratase [Cupriavidus sp. MP-37]|uniref:type II 3-dehydroquinate dehydratase n=1 Tax=Cupriavidus sp. MP-37 TaxID=2884455 RepID=UPI001D0B092D|nr:type II 3-dehydroquinate dehydratase [Cupriavidus sp. MP-37]UDM51971.1 type II 3-dehydroquinate dehydratase [Cupriavidus sp. MP-37]
MRILLIQGANMEYLGFRQPELYGTTTAVELDEMLRADAAALGMQLDILYTNVEGEAISAIYRAARDQIDGLVMNPAGFLYAGLALRDCLKAVPLPCIEVHMTNIDARGMHSVTASESAGMVTGLGVDSYRLALIAIQKVINKRKKHA